MVDVSIRHIANIKGPQGRQGDRGAKGLPGSFVGATAQSVPWSAGANVTVTGPPDARIANFDIPEGQPGTNGVATEEAIATYLDAKHSLPRVVTDDLYASKGGSLAGMPGFRNLTFRNQVTTAAATGEPSVGYPCVVSNRDGFIPGYPNYIGLYSTDHTGGTAPGILMVAFNEHGDPWGDAVPIVNHGTQLETPWLVFDRARGRMILYGSGLSMEPDQFASQVTVAWTTTPARFAADPTDWDYRGVAFDWRNGNSGFLTNSPTNGTPHTGYQKPAIIGGGFVSWGQTVGGGNSYRDVWYSTSGINWFRGYAQSANQVDVNDYGDDWRVLLDHYFEWSGQVWGAGRIRGTGTSGSGSGSGTRLVIGRMRDDLSGFAGRPQHLFTPPETGDGHNGDIRGFCLVVEDSRMHLYYGSSVESINYAEVSV